MFFFSFRTVPPEKQKKTRRFSPKTKSKTTRVVNISLFSPDFIIGRLFKEEKRYF